MVSKLCGDLEDPPQALSQLCEVQDSTRRTSSTKRMQKDTPGPSSLKAHSLMRDREVNNQTRVVRSPGRALRQGGIPEEVTWRLRRCSLQRQGCGRAGRLRTLQTPEAPHTWAQKQAVDAIKINVKIPQALRLPVILKMEKRAI